MARLAELPIVAVPAARPLATAPGELHAGTPCLLRVAGVLPYDMLAMRAGPGGEHALVARIPPRTRGLAGLGPILQGWALVRWDGRTGWVECRRLARESVGQAERATYRVTGMHEEDVLPVRAGPSPASPIVGILRPLARGIELAGPVRRSWYPIRHHTASGWVEARHLAPEAT